MDERIKKADDLIRKGKASLAVGIIKEVLKERPEDPYLYYLLGVARMKCVRFFLAKRALEKADKLLPNHADNLRTLGWVKVMLGQVEEGRNDLRKAINLDLMNPLSYVDLAMSYFHYFDFAEGRAWLERALALAPRDSFVLSTAETAKELKKEYSNYSTQQLQAMLKEKLDPQYQRFFRISMLQNYYTGKPLTKDEADEVQEEAKLNGAPAAVITEKQEKELVITKDKSKLLKVKEILKRRKEIEKKLLDMLKETESDFGLDDIKEIIYNEEGQDDLTKVIAMFDRGQGAVELENILDLINDAWNYFPHKCLDGLCPMEKILEYHQNQKKINL